MSKLGSLVEEMPKEQARVREVLSHYKAIGRPGMFGAMMIEESLRAADEAAISGDVIAMLHAYNDLKEIKG